MDVVEETSQSSESTEKQKSNIRFYENNQDNEKKERKSNLIQTHIDKRVLATQVHIC